MPIHINVAGVWKEVDKVHINVGGVWKECDDVPINVGGVWKTGLLYSGPSVSPSTANVIWEKFTSPGSAYAIVKFDNNGIQYKNSSATSTSVTTSMGTWLDSGLNSEVWIERVISSGSFNYTDSGSGRLSLATDRSFGVSRSSNGTTTCTCTFNFYDAASGGNLIGTTGLRTIRAREDAI